MSNSIGLHLLQALELSVLGQLLQISLSLSHTHTLSLSRSQIILLVFWCRYAVVYQFDTYWANERSGMVLEAGGATPTDSASGL